MKCVDVTRGEAERLHYLIEECGEVIQAATKILRFGYMDIHPVTGLDNTEILHRELGDLQAVLTLMQDYKDIKLNEIQKHVPAKYIKFKKYSRFQAQDYLDRYL